MSGLTEKQRYPWNGLVDISFTLSGPQSGYCIAVTAKNAATGAEIPMRTFRDASGNALYTRKFAPGSVSFVWDADADAPDLVVETLALSVRTAPPPPPSRVQLWEGGPYWADRNIGAEDPRDYGLYFWWGDTVGYRYEKGKWVASNGSTLNFFFVASANACTIQGYRSDDLIEKGWVVLKDGATNLWDDGSTILAPKHDAAQVHWGGGWRMPTYDEVLALHLKCSVEFIIQNGIPGALVRGRGDYASASIFLPAAGYGQFNVNDGVGKSGLYWAASPFQDWASFGISFFIPDGFFDGTGGDRRYVGGCVRPVQGFSE